MKQRSTQASAQPSHWRLLVQLLRPHLRTVVLLAVVLAASSALPLAAPQLLRAFVDAAVADASTLTLAGVALAFIALGAGAQVASVGTAYVATRLAWAATNSLRERAAEHVLRLDLSFHAAHAPGALVERVDGDATAITRFFTDFVIRVIGAALTLAGAVLLVAREDWRVGAALGLLVLVSIVIAARLRDRAVPQTAAERAAFADAMGLVAEQLEGSEDLRALGAREHALARHEDAGARHLRAALRANLAGGVIYSWMAAFFALAAAGMLVASWLLLRADAITLGTALLLYSYTQVVRTPIEQLADELEEVQEAAAGAARMSELLEERSSLTWNGRSRLPLGALDVSFEGVSFAYTDRAADGSAVSGSRVLHDVSLKVPAGAVVGLVGSSGSGKTTLARLALRLVDPTAGVVRIGGVDLRTVARSSLLQRVAIVTQDVHLLDGTVRDNLTLYESGHDDGQLTALLTDLGLGTWAAELHDGLDTPMDAAPPLSSGQAQLLAIGRAFLRDPGLVVLDEASARIDPATAEMVEAALDRLLAGRTALVIAHRLRAVERADHVVVLDRGHLVEHGPRAVLAADPSSRYGRLVALSATGVDPDLDAVEVSR